MASTGADNVANELGKIDLNDKNRRAGGANTTVNGMAHEKKAAISEIEGYVKLSKKKFNKYMASCGYFDSKVKQMHGCKEPDQAFVSVIKKILIIKEDKTQKSSGSVCEKLQTVDKKIKNYEKQYPDFKVYYIFCLCSWFKNNCKAEIEMLEEDKIPVFWTYEQDYNTKVENFIKNLK